MRSHANTVPLTRRQLLWIIGAALPGQIYAFASDFWNKKDPSDWSPAEVHQLLTKSPWAKQITAYASSVRGVRSVMGDTPGPSNGRYGDATGPGGAGQVSGRAHDLSSKTEEPAANGPLQTQGHQFRGIVRWESARPLLDATKTTLADTFANHYVVSVGGVPLGDTVGVSGSPKFSKSTVEQVMTATTLTAGGKHMATAQVAQVAGDTIRLGFSKESIQLSEHDEEVSFSTIINRITIKAKFNLKEMIYRGALAI